LSSAVCFAKKMEVVGLDNNQTKVKSLNAGSTTIHEKDLDKLLKAGLTSRRLTFTSEYKHLLGAEIFFIAVGTPSLTSGRIDLSQIKSATDALGEVIGHTDDYPVVVVKSTVVPGTASNLVRERLQKLSAKKAGVGFGLCSNPEFLREGSAIQDTLHPDRIVIGSYNARTLRLMRNFYRRFYGKNTPEIVETDHFTAELVKYASNAFLATKISFTNLIARICEKLPRSNIDEVAHAMGLDPRIGGLFLEAGPGFGGSCFPKDVKALIDYAERLDVDTSLLDAVQEINETQPDHVLSLSKDLLGGLTGKTVAVLGVSFKPGTDDIRESRAMKLIEILLRDKVRARIYDPTAIENAKEVLGSSVIYCKSALECISGADLVVIMNAEAEFKKLKSNDFLRRMKRPVVIDTRRMYRPDEFDGKVHLISIGRSGQLQ
jgi:UDPglucose 6-dehydrogenase